MALASSLFGLISKLKHSCSTTVLQNSTDHTCRAAKHAIHFHIPWAALINHGPAGKKYTHQKYGFAHTFEIPVIRIHVRKYFFLAAMFLVESSFCDFQFSSVFPDVTHYSLQYPNRPCDPKAFAKT